MRIDLAGKIAFVRVGYTGIGLETTKRLAAAGTTVIVPVRDTEKAKKPWQVLKMWNWKKWI